MKEKSELLRDSLHVMKSVIVAYSAGLDICRGQLPHVFS